MEREPNSEQQQVIQNLDNNIILYASAGTGKTFSVANRVNNILNSQLATPKEILCLTFTNKACEEMREDLQNYVGHSSKDIHIRTIHSFCLYLLRIEAKKRKDMYGNIDVCDEVDEAELLSNILSERGIYWTYEDALAENKEHITYDEVCNSPVFCDGKDQIRWAVDKQDHVICMGKNDYYTYLGTVKKFTEDHSGFYCPKDYSGIRCPECGTIVMKRFTDICETCGYDFRQMPQNSRQSEVFSDKLNAVVSEIKQCRYKYGFKTNNERLDYRNTIDCILNNMYERQKWIKLFKALKKGDKLEPLFEKHGADIIAVYNEMLRLCNRMDYDDLILEAGSALDDNITRAYWQNKFKYIIIDEMQDTSELEYHVLEKIFGNNRVMLCGDFFQTIYQWKGSNPDIVLNKFTHDYNPVAYMYYENYRATITLANATFGYLKNAFPSLIGKYCPRNLKIHCRERGKSIIVGGYDDIDSEARYIFKHLSTATDSYRSGVCLLARSNSYINAIVGSFDRLNESCSFIPENKKLKFFTVERNHSFYKTASVKDILAFFRIILNKTDCTSMDRIALRFIKNVGCKTIGQFHNYSQLGVNICAFLNPDTYAHGDHYYSLIEAAQNGNIIVYDTESTGLDITTDQVIQIAAIKYDSYGNEIDTFNEILIPTVEISSSAKAVIPFDVDKEIRTRGISAAIGFKRFSAFVDGSVLVGHNSTAYDAPLIARQLNDLHLPELKIKVEYDTLILSKQFCSNLHNYRLDTICRHFSITNENAHNALGDVRATGAVLWKIIDKYIIPTSKDRTKILTKFIKRFLPFYEYMQNLENNLFTGNYSCCDAADDIIDNYISRYKYSSNTAYKAVSDVHTILNGAEYDNIRSFMQEFVTNAAISGSQMDFLMKKLKQIPIITVHQAKGCEFDTVFLVGVTSSNFPSYFAQDEETLEEEKRVFYVAISRAKKQLYITYPKINQFGYPTVPSPYIKGIPEEYLCYLNQ